MSNRLRFLRNVLYRLKRRYGEPLHIFEVTSSVVDRATGEQTTRTSRTEVGRVIVLPSQVDREFAYDLAFIAAAKNFTYGGFFDTTERRFIFDTNELPIDFEIKQGMYLIFNDLRYDVKRVEAFEDGRAFFITAKQLTVMAATDRDIFVELVDEVSLTDEAEAEVT